MELVSACELPHLLHLFSARFSSAHDTVKKQSTDCFMKVRTTCTTNEDERERERGRVLEIVARWASRRGIMASATAAMPPGSPPPPQPRRNERRKAKKAAGQTD